MPERDVQAESILIGSRRIQRGTYRSAGSAENGLKESGPKTSSERPQYGPVTPLSSEWSGFVAGRGRRMKQRGWNRDKMKNIVPFCRQRQKGAFFARTAHG